jgi:hypothetical protein
MEYKEILEKYSHELPPRALEYFQEYMKTPNYCKVAEVFGVHESTVRRTMLLHRSKLNVKQSTVPEHMNEDVAEPFSVKGYSAMYDADGNRKMHWIKTKRDQSDMYNELKAAIEDLASELPKWPRTKRESKTVDPKLLTVYPIGDPHIGLLTYTPEVGDNWDLKIAEKMFMPLFKNLIASAPPSEECLIVDLGDFWHYDGMEQRTMRSGHKVDADGRPSKMVQVGFRIMLSMIHYALLVHKKVNVKILPGNHDDFGSIFLRVSLHHIFEKDPRVNVDLSPAVFQYFDWGNNLLGMHHGDKCKMARLPMVMAADQAKLWGETEHRKWLVGHFHSDKSIIHRGEDLQGCTVETFRSIIPNEGYAHEAGYRSPQDGKALIFHKDHGEIARYTVNISQIR